MERMFVVVSKIFDAIFIRTNSILYRVILHIVQSPFLLISTVLMIIGFSIGILKRIIHS